MARDTYDHDQNKDLRRRTMDKPNQSSRKRPRVSGNARFRRPRITMLPAALLLYCCILQSTGGAFLGTPISCPWIQRDKFRKVQSKLLLGDSINGLSLPSSHPSSNQAAVNFQSIESHYVANIRQSLSLDELESFLRDFIEASEQASGVDLFENHINYNYISPNVAAGALRRITILTQQSRARSRKNSEKEKLLADRSHLLRLGLFDRISEVLGTFEKSTLTIHAMVDALHSLAFFHQETAREPGGKTLWNDNKQQLAISLVRLIEENLNKVTRSLGPARLVDILQSFHVLGIGRIHENSFNQNHDDLNPAAKKIQKLVCKQLCQGNVLSQLASGDMSITLNILALNGQSFHEEENRLAIALMRRFRKQAVRQSARNRHLLRALRAVSKIARQAREMTISDKDDSDKLYNEAKIMTYTVFKDLLKGNTNPEDKHRHDMITLRQLTEVLSFVEAFGFWEKGLSHQNNEVEDPAFQAIWEIFVEAQGQTMFENASLFELSSFLRYIERLQSRTISIPAKTMQLIGEISLEEVTLMTNGTKSKANPKIVNAILRCATHSHGVNQTIMRPFLQCADQLFTSDDFLLDCQAPELANFLAFLEKTRFVTTSSHNETLREQNLCKEDALLALGYRILDQDVTDSCTPSQASRILSHFTTVVMDRSKRSQRDFERSAPKDHRVLSDLFHVLGEHFLTSGSTELSPRDISSALCAYAKFSYVRDMGIFDHLASLMADRVDDCSVRQVAQSLWACGKMTVWEQQQQEEDQSVLPSEQQDQGISYPPYMPSAEEFAKFLSKHVDELSSKDVAQCIWALGRLQTVQPTDDLSAPAARAMDKFVSRARSLCPKLTPQEVANILWGLSRSGFEDDKTVYLLINRLLYLSQSSPPQKPNPQEAANTMYALARMDIQDEELFSVLSKDILDQLEDASAQAIANTLWAHRAVQITPPRQLLDEWATQKLGLVAVQTRLKP